MKLHKSDLFEEQTRKSHNDQLVKKQVPSFRVAWIPAHDGLFRDIPTKVMEILLPMAFRYTKGIAFGMFLQAFAGLRAGEVCNVRQESSLLGAGIRFVEAGSSVIKAEIDLRRELALRSDRVEIGKIKRDRLQCVYSAFLDAFSAALVYSSVGSPRGGYCRSTVLTRRQEFEKRVPVFTEQRRPGAGVEGYE